jgi:hypothetical protein
VTLHKLRHRHAIRVRDKPGRRTANLSANRNSNARTSQGRTSPDFQLVNSDPNQQDPNGTRPFHTADNKQAN